MTKTVLSTSYFPPIPWFQLAHQVDSIIIDIGEHYQKQTWRNRCQIVTANGLMDLVVPVVKHRNHTPVKDIQVDYSTNWKRVHHHAIRSAYGNSLYYTYYSDLFDQMFAQHVQPKFLKDWNEISIELIREGIRLKLPYEYSNDYIELNTDQPDYRKLLIPGSSTGIPETTRYIQVFEERHGFYPALSIIDLLFCEGPDAIMILNSI